MTPHFVLWYCVECGRNGFKDDVPDCISGGRYCAPDPDSTGPITGRHIVMENLRQLCIYRYAEHKNNFDIWWNYIAEFGSCTFGLDCSTKAMKKAKIDIDFIYLCIDGSVNGKDINIDNNWILEKEKEMMIERGIFFYPSFIINNQAFRGDMEVEEIAVALCAGFNLQPEICDEYMNNGETVKVETGISKYTILLIVIFSLISLLVILFFYRKWLRNDMNSRMKTNVSHAVSQYIALTDQSLNRDH